MRLPGRRSASCGKVGGPASKTMENAKVSFHCKKELLKLLQKLGMDNLVDSVQFTSMTTLRLEGVCVMYNMKQIAPSPLGFKYLTSRSALNYALTSALGLQSKSKRATRYNHEDTCIVPLKYKRRKGGSTFIRASERINQETKEMRAFYEQYTRGAKVMNLRQYLTSRPGTLPLCLSKASLRGKSLQIVDVEATPLVEWLKSNSTVSKTAVKRKIEEKRSVKNADAVTVQERQESDLLITAQE